MLFLGVERASCPPLDVRCLVVGEMSAQVLLNLIYVTFSVEA